MRLRKTAGSRARALGLAGVLAMIAFFITCGRLGVDFGFHWDEGYEQQGVRTSVQKLMALPQWYVYGNVYFLVGMGVVAAHNLRFLPAFVHEMRSRTGEAIQNVETYQSVQDFQREALGFIDSPRYFTETRMAFLCISSLAALWVYLTLRKLRPNRTLPALAAAGYLVFSWELQYHARWIAMDALMTQVIAGQFLLLVHALRAGSPRARRLAYGGAAVAAGLAFSTKAPGLLALFPLTLLPFLLQERLSLVRRAGLAVLGWLVAAATTVMVQPAILVDPLRFVGTLGAQSHQYTKDLSHPSYTSGVLERLSKFLAWLWLALPSPFLALAIVMSAVTLFGLYCLVVRHRREALLAGTVAGTLFLMMLTHPLLNVRQYLMLSSLLAVGFGLGIVTLYDLLEARAWARRALLVALVMIFFFNGRFLYDAALGIRDLTDEEVHRQAAAELLAHPQPVRLSPQLAVSLAPRLDAGYLCRSDAGDAGTDVPVVIRAREHPWRANVLGFSRRMFGSREANYDWYPTWVGRSERSPILILSPANAQAQELPVREYTACTPRSPAG